MSDIIEIFYKLCRLSTTYSNWSIVANNYMSNIITEKKMSNTIIATRSQQEEHQQCSRDNNITSVRLRDYIVKDVTLHRHSYQTIDVFTLNDTFT